MNTEQERAEFEAWYRHHHGSLDVYALDESGEYVDKQVQGAFNVWQARAALQSQEYTAAIGEAGQAYLDRFKNAHALPTEFRWSELWAVMCVAANKGRTDALQSQDREEFCEWHNDPETDNSWDTGCRQLFELYDGTPSENRMSFFCYCGKKIREAINRYAEGES